MKNKIEFRLHPLLIAWVYLMLTNSCNKEDTGIHIGQSYQGGIIAYILKAGDPGYVADTLHGLIAAPSDQSTGITWNIGSGYIETGAVATAIGTGNANTNKIVNSLGSGNYAAYLCYDLVLGGYSDWYLPSKDELYKIGLYRETLGGNYGFSYWSSSESESDKYSAWGIYIGYIIFKTNKNSDVARVCAVRSF